MIVRTITIGEYRLDTGAIALKPPAGFRIGFAARAISLTGSGIRALPLVVVVVPWANSSGRAQFKSSQWEARIVRHQVQAPPMSLDLQLQAIVTILSLINPMVCATIFARV